MYQIGHPSSHCLAGKPSSIISVFSCIGNWLRVQYFEESAVTRQCRALIRSVWVWASAVKLKVFTWRNGSKVHVSSTAIYSFLTIKMKRGRNALLFEV